MHFDDFTSLISNASAPVILVEGQRSVSEKGAHSATRLTTLLARHFPQLRFRSGNATGADEAFAAGIIATLPERLEIVAPYASHRLRARHPLVRYDSPDSLSPDELASVQALTSDATPANRGLVKCYGRGGRAGGQAACLIRDTLKVTGIPGQLSPPVVALFWVDLSDPEAGGTGHTIRACRLSGIPVVFQNHWDAWPIPNN